MVQMSQRLLLQQKQSPQQVLLSTLLQLPMLRLEQRIKQELELNEDYYINESGFWVFTAAYLLKRGYCCQQGCKHCPYRNTDEK